MGDPNLDAYAAMANDNNSADNVSRRSILQTLGAGTAAVSLGSMSGAARGEDELEIEETTDVTLDNVLDRDPVRAIRSELSRTQSQTSQSPSVLGASVSDATQTVAHDEGNVAVIMVSVPTAHGTLLVGEFGDGSTHATLRFDQSSTYPMTVQESPSEVESALDSDGNGVDFVREASASELKRIGDVLDEDPRTLTAATETDDVFRVVRESSGDDPTDSLYRVDLSREVDVTPVNSPQDDGYCDVICAACTSGLTPCGACASLCLGGISAPACILCALHTCATKAPFCYECADCQGWI